MSETIDPESRILIDSELRSLSNESLVLRYESLNIGYLRDQLSEEDNREQDNMVLREINKELYRDFLVYIIAPGRKDSKSTTLA